jgi:hypothetical protein
MTKTRIVVVIALLSLLTLSAFSTINTNTNALTPDHSYKGTGQVAAAHWEIPPINNNNAVVLIDAFFADQLKTPDGTIYTNGLYIKVTHVSFGVDEAIESLVSGEISWEGSLMTIDVKKMAFSGARAGSHDILLVWDFDQVTAEIKIGNLGQNHRPTYSTVDFGRAIIGETENPDVLARVTKDKGNTNTLGIYITESWTRFIENADELQPFSKICSKEFTINNNAAAVYTVDDYNVFVDTKGNDQIRACYFV